MRALQFENQNERLVYELTRLDRPGTPEKAVAVLLEKHPRKRHDAAALMADNVPRGKYECGKYKQCMYSYDDVRAVAALVVDMDDHDYTDPAAMRTHLLEGIAALQLMWDNGQCGALPVPAIEDSGRGIHLWWIFSQAIPYAADTDTATWYKKPCYGYQVQNHRYY